MADTKSKLVRLKDAEGNVLYPKITPASIDDGSITKEKLAAGAGGGGLQTPIGCFDLHDYVTIVDGKAKSKTIVAKGKGDIKLDKGGGVAGITWGGWGGYGTFKIGGGWGKLSYNSNYYAFVICIDAEGNIDIYEGDEVVYHYDTADITGSGCTAKGQFEELLVLDVDSSSNAPLRKWLLNDSHHVPFHKQQINCPTATASIDAESGTSWTRMNGSLSAYVCYAFTGDFTNDLTETKTALLKLNNAIICETESKNVEAGATETIHGLGIVSADGYNTGTYRDSKMTVKGAFTPLAISWGMCVDFKFGAGLADMATGGEAAATYGTSPAKLIDNAFNATGLNLKGYKGMLAINNDKAYIYTGTVWKQINNA